MGPEGFEGGGALVSVEISLLGVTTGEGIGTVGVGVGCRLLEVLLAESDTEPTAAAAATLTRSAASVRRQRAAAMIGELELG